MLHLTAAHYDSPPREARDYPATHGLVAKRVAGYGVVEGPALKKALGTSYYVWLRFLSARDPQTGLAFIQLPKLARTLDRSLAPRGGNVTRKVLVRHVRKLTDAGLIVPVQWAPHPRSKVWTKARLVLGDDLSPNTVLRVPRRTEAWLAAFRGWGGAREHSGRRSKGEFKMGQALSRRGAIDPEIGFKTGQLLTQVKRVSDPCTLLAFPPTGGKAPAAGAAGVSLSIETQSSLLSRPAFPVRRPPKTTSQRFPYPVRRPPTLPSGGVSLPLPSLAPTPEVKAAPEATSELETLSAIELIAQWNSLREWGSEYVAGTMSYAKTFGPVQRHPAIRRITDLDLRTVQRIWIAAMPRLPSEMKPRARVEFLMTTYLNALEKWHGKQWGKVLAWKKQRDEVPYLKWPHRAKLEACAEALIEAELSPAAWMVHAAVQWDKVQEKKGNVDDRGASRTPVPFASVWSPDRIVREQGWAREQHSREVLETSPHTESIRNIQRSVRQAIEVDAITHDGVEDFVVSLLPGVTSAAEFIDVWDRLVNAVKKRVSSEQDSVRRKASEGAWLW